MAVVKQFINVYIVKKWIGASFFKYGLLFMLYPVPSSGTRILRFVCAVSTCAAEECIAEKESLSFQSTAAHFFTNISLSAPCSAADMVALKRTWVSALSAGLFYSLWPCLSAERHSRTDIIKGARTWRPCSVYLSRSWIPLKNGKPIFCGIRAVVLEIRSPLSPALVVGSHLQWDAHN